MRRPRLCLAQAFGAAQGFQVEELEALLDDAERAYAVSGDEPYEPSLGPPQGDSVLANVPAGIAFLRASLARLRGDAALAAGYNRQALAQLGDDDWFMRPSCAGTWRWRMMGGSGPAERGLAEVLAERRAAGQGFPRHARLNDPGVQRAQGHLDAALATLWQALDTAEATAAASHPICMAWAGPRRGRAGRRTAPDPPPVTLCRQLASTAPPAVGLAAARIRQAQGRPRPRRRWARPGRSVEPQRSPCSPGAVAAGVAAAGPGRCQRGHGGQGG